MSYKVIQPQKNGKFYLYEATAEWDPEKKCSKQRRKYLGVCDKDGNLISETFKSRTIQCSPVYGSYYVMYEIAKQMGLDETLTRIYGDTDGKRLLALAILGVVNPSSVDLMEDNIEDSYLREMIDTDWSFEQSSVCRFIQKIGKDIGRREELFCNLAPESGCVIFDIVCLGTDSEELEYAEAGRKTRYTHAKQMNVGMVHSMEDGLPFCYRTYPGSVADVTTLDIIVADLKRMGCDGFEVVMDRGFFSSGNIGMLVGREAGFTVPVPARNDIHKLLISSSVKDIESPLNTDILNGKTVSGYETGVVLLDGEFSMAIENSSDVIRAVVFQDDERRTLEKATLFKRINELEEKLSGRKYDGNIGRKLSVAERAILNLLDVSEGDDGCFAVERKRNAITAKANACGRFAVLTTSTLDWKSLLIQYRQRNEVEYDFSMLQSDLFNGVLGKSDQHSAEGGLLVNFLSLRLRLELISRMKEAKLTDKIWVPKLMATMGKLKMSCIGGEWRLNEVTKSQREIMDALGIKLP